MFPYYHPTSVLLVDDDPSFLESMRFYFGDRFNCLGFQRPAEALTFIDSIGPAAYAPPRTLMPSQGAVDQMDYMPGDIVLQMRMTGITELFGNAKRFHLPSVVIVDYAMPGMTGIEFLRKIGKLPIKRLMLTGRADERTAIAAFNDGVIDSFFMKHEPDLAEALANKILQLQKDFFVERTAALSSFVTMAAPFVGDAIFQTSFETIAEQHGIIEYCVLTEPYGVLGLKSDGTQIFVLVADDDYVQAAIEIALAEQAPRALLDALSKPDVLALFPTPNGFYRSSLVNQWQHFIMQAQTTEGQRSWRYAVVEKPAALGLGIPLPLSYDAFLDQVATQS